MSAKMRGKKFFPSGQGSIVAAVDQAYGIPTSAGFGSDRAANRSVASCAPAAVIALGGRWPARLLRDRQHLPVDDVEERREQEARESPARAATSA